MIKSKLNTKLNAEGSLIKAIDRVESTTTGHGDSVIRIGLWCPEDVGSADTELISREDTLRLND